ncbi:DNA replication licensing factor mcm5, putative [Perkinsus marinus ATCC 50983]|uniref:DNA replication licensing factor MCM5 n=1 Tax=Perkinsus marinus (strain ATCC 50983 / TXsc) TaxID=423536 RepID=C5LTI2_PERM5|nr:DNA replication licensing factor mcm5, putative [Perkinsus marinus ATCC 50983]EEQ99973.1 DNA replication licensing factor mcm5, putative [Perkinsus marinus ATCC 50983]|eukprot:XP_002767256.1 DNA replication licensing factor mcm5, putative [Perkinsus marinus ATCC 50983]
MAGAGAGMDGAFYYGGGGGFDDEPALDQNLLPANEGQARAGFKRFVKEFRQGQKFVYRDQLIDNWSRGVYSMTLSVHHLDQFAPALGHALRTQPQRFMSSYEQAMQDVFIELSGLPEPVDGGQVQVDDQGFRRGMPTFQLKLASWENPKLIRELQSEHVERLVVIPGIIVQASIKVHKAFKLRIRCKKCGHSRTLDLKPTSRSKTAIPRRCARELSAGPDGEKCGLDPYIIVSEQCQYQDTQTLKIQELPEDVPTGEMPRSIPVHCTRYLTDTVNPVSVVGVFSTEDRNGDKKKDNDGSVKVCYVQALGFMPHGDVTGRGGASGNTLRLSPADEERDATYVLSFSECSFVQFASVAPAIRGSVKDCISDLKIAIACLLFGGAQKTLQDGTRLRGDINVLMLGDPGTAKSQFLKFTEQVAPIAVYTSGKGSSAAGLTAAIIRDADGRFALEGGAMVLADGGVVCIDEFDKMRPDDRVAIHEAMEQQTISIAKAGITTILNTRCSVLAAANPLFGQWMDVADAAEQMDFATTILSRFDLIFLVKDVKDEERDLAIAKHVFEEEEEVTDAPIKVQDLKKYIAFARHRCSPKLTPEAANVLQNHYIQVRQGVSKERREGHSTIPITVRQLEAITRISEAFAKMSLSEWVQVSHVEDAVRLFTLATLDAANRNQMGGGALTDEDRQKVYQVEDAIKRRLQIRGRRPKTALHRELEKDFEPKHVQQAISESGWGAAWQSVSFQKPCYSVKFWKNKDTPMYDVLETMHEVSSKFMSICSESFCV